MIPTALRFFQQSRLIYRRLQAVLKFSLMGSGANTHTHKVPFDKSLFPSYSSFCKIYTPFTPIISSRRCYWKISVQ